MNKVSNDLIVSACCGCKRTAAEGIYYSAGVVQKFYHLIGKLITSDPSRWEMSMQPSPARTAVVNAVIYVVERLCQGGELVLKSRSFSFYPDCKRPLQRVKGFRARRAGSR